MPSNRDILEAQRFNRRRLVTAFTSGTPGGRELEPRSPLRPLMVGGVLMLVMALVGLAAGRLGGSLPNGWTDNWVLLEKGGDRFYTSHGVLHPLRNLTTAKLLADNGQVKSQSVSSRQLRNRPRGGEVGIKDAPEDVPPRADLRSSEWTSCLVPAPSTAGQNAPAITDTWIAEPVQGLQRVDSSAQFVQVVGSDGTEQYLVEGTRKYQVKGTAINVLNLLNPMTVPATWLNLFPSGAPLSNGVPMGDGALLTAGPQARGFPQGVGIGTVLTVGTASNAEAYLVTGDNQMAPLRTEVERTMAASVNKTTRSMTEAQLAQVKRVDLDVDWPASITPAPTGQLACAQVVNGATSLAWIPAPAAGTQLPTADIVTVGGGSGALVSASDVVNPTASSSLADGSQPTLISDSGVAYPLASPHQETSAGQILKLLGYQESDVVPIPQPWLRLVTTGVKLSPEAAQQSLTP